MRKLVKFISYSAFVSAILLIGIFFIINDKEILNPLYYALIPFIATSLYVILCFALFGSQLLKSNNFLGSKVTIYVFIFSCATIGLLWVFAALEAYIGILDLDVFYTTMENGRMRLNDNFKLLWLTSTTLALVVNFSLKDRTFLRKLPLFHN